MAETIVMIHGMWGGGWYWENYKNFLEQRGFQCYTPTLRYHDMDPNDKPDPGLGATSLLDYAQDLEEYIHNLDQKPFLMGHSMGGPACPDFRCPRIGQGPCFANACVSERNKCVEVFCYQKLLERVHKVGILA